MTPPIANEVAGYLRAKAAMLEEGGETILADAYRQAARLVELDYEMEAAK